MKYLILTDAWHPQVNGVVRTYESLKLYLEALGHEVVIISPADFRLGVAAPGYKEIKLACVPYPMVAKKIKEQDADFIHIATEGPIGWLARKYCRKNKRAFTSSYHSQFPHYFALRLTKYAPFLFPLYYKIGIQVIKRFHNASSGVFVTTKSMTEELKKWGIKSPILPLTRGIDKQIFNTQKRNEADEMLNTLKPPVALYVGRLAIEKNVQEFLDMPWDEQGTKLVVGHGPLEESFKKKYPNVIFRGKQTGVELADHYRAADVFVFPSLTDTFGIVLIEALACGVPIAAYPVIGPIDVVTDDILGTLDDDIGAAAVKALKKGTANQRAEHVQNHYNWDVATAQFIAGSKQAENIK